MFKKSLLAVALLVAVSAAAQAGSTISDKGYWPSEARRTTHSGTFTQRDLNSAFASDRATSAYEPATPEIAGRPAWRYQGGPKFH
jgi:hypothetical protein